MRKQTGRSRFGLQQSSLHAHTGNDGTPQIKAENVIPSLSASGSITMSSEAIYTLQFDSSFTPRQVMAYGNVIDGGQSWASMAPSYWIGKNATVLLNHWKFIQ